MDGRRAGRGFLPSWTWWGAHLGIGTCPVIDKLEEEPSRTLRDRVRAHLGIRTRPGVDGVGKAAEPHLVHGEVTPAGSVCGRPASPPPDRCSRRSREREWVSRLPGAIGENEWRSGSAGRQLVRVLLDELNPAMPPRFKSWPLAVMRQLAPPPVQDRLQLGAPGAVMGLLGGLPKSRSTAGRFTAQPLPNPLDAVTTRMMANEVARRATVHFIKTGPFLTPVLRRGALGSRRSVGDDGRGRAAVALELEGDGIYTVLISDLERSTELWEQHDQGMQPVIVAHNELVSAAVAADDGYVQKFRGDGVLALFLDAPQAVAAAVQMQVRFHRTCVRRGGRAPATGGDHDGILQPARRRALRTSTESGVETRGCRARRADRAVGRDGQACPGHLPDDVELFELGRYEIRGYAGADRAPQRRGRRVARRFPSAGVPRRGGSTSSLTRRRHSSGGISSSPTWRTPCASTGSSRCGGPRVLVRPASPSAPLYPGTPTVSSGRPLRGPRRGGSSLSRCRRP